MVGGVSVGNQYELNYWHEWSELTMLFDSAFASYKIFDYDFNEVAADADFWLTFSAWAENTKGKVTMDPAKFSNPYAEVPESFIVFYDESGKALAGVCCKYTSTGGGASAALELSVMDGEAQVSTLAPETELYQILAGNLGVSTVFEVQAAGDAIFQLNQPFAMASVFDMTLNTSTAVACECFDQNCVYVSPQPGAEVVIILKNEMWVNVAAIHYTCATSGGGAAEIVPTETLGLMSDYGAAVKLDVMSASNPAAEVLLSKYNTPNIWTLDCVNQTPVLTYTTTVASVEVLDESFQPATAPTVNIMGGTMLMVVAPSVKDITRVLLLKDSSNAVIGVILYTFTF